MGTEISDRFGTRPARFRDTGEAFEIVTIDGEPVAMEPTPFALERYAERRELKLVTAERMRDLDRDARSWRILKSASWLRRLRLLRRADAE